MSRSRSNREVRQTHASSCTAPEQHLGVLELWHKHGAVDTSVCSLILISEMTRTDDMFTRHEVVLQCPEPARPVREADRRRDHATGKTRYVQLVTWASQQGFLQATFDSSTHDTPCDDLRVLSSCSGVTSSSLPCRTQAAIRCSPVGVLCESSNLQRAPISHLTRISSPSDLRWTDRSRQRPAWYGRAESARQA